MNECFNTPFGNLFKKKNNFSGEDRIILSMKICEYLVNHLIKPTPNIFEDLARQIVSIFPHEMGSESIYYKKDEKNKPSGILYIKYAKVCRNSKSILKLKASIEKNISESEDEENNDEELETFANSEESLCWLERNRNPTRNLFPELLNHWALTSWKRNPKKNVEIEKWPQYKMTIGNELISIDFKYHNKLSTNLERNNALTFFDKNLPTMKHLIHSSKFKQNCEDLNQIEDEGMKYENTIYLIKNKKKVLIF